MNGIQDCLKLEYAPNVKVLTGTEKKCSKCGKSQSIENDYYPDYRARDKRQSWCKNCFKNYSHSPETKKREKERNYKQKWRKRNPEKQRNLSRNANRKKRNTIRGNLDDCMTTKIYISLKGHKKGRRWELLVDYTCEELRVHLEERFLPGMTWENRDLWHIDHIIPKAAFNYLHPEDIDFSGVGR